MNKFILGSSSKSRLELLEKIGIKPDIVAPADIDETPLKNEKPEDYVKRISIAKCQKTLETYQQGCVLTADTIVTRNRKIMQKAHNNEELLKFLHFLSGKSCKVLTVISLGKNGKLITSKLISTKIKFKNFTDLDIRQYLEFGNGLNKAGGIYIEGLMDSFVLEIHGSYSNIRGLPLYETRNLLLSNL